MKLIWGRSKNRRADEARRLNERQLPRRSAGGLRVPIESLEPRMLLSVSATTLVGPYLTTGAVFNYSLSGTVNGDPETGTLTYTIAGSSTAPNGATGIEVDETGVASVTTSSGTKSGNLSVKEWFLLTSAGYVEIASENTAPNGTVTDDAFSPPRVGLPVTLMGGQANDEDTTDTTTTTDTGGTTTTGTTDQADVITLASEIPQSLTVTAGKFSAFMVTDNRTNTPTGGTANVETDTTYWSPQVGVIEIVTSGSTAQTVQLTSYSIPGDTLQFLKQPVDTPTGQTLPTVSVEFLNSKNVVDTAINGAVTLVLKGGDGTLSGTIPVDASSGIATFSDLSVNNGGTYALLASSASANGMGLSNPFTITGTTLTWTGGGDGTSWSDPTNWAEDQAPEGGESLVFPDSVALSPNNDIGALSLNSINISGSGYTLTGNPISLSGSLNSESGSNTYNIGTTLFGTPTINDQAGFLTIQSVLSSGGVSFTGNGTVILDAANTYSGDTTINPGVTVDLATSNANLGTGQLILASTPAGGASAPQIINTVTAAPPFLPNITLANPVVFQNGASLSTDGALIFSGPVTLDGSNDLLEPANDATTMEFDGNISGTGTLNTNVSGKVIVMGNVDIGSTLSVSAGELDFGGKLLAATTDPSQVSVLGGTLQLLSGITGAGGIDISGGTLASGGAAGYSGIVTVESGTETLNLTPAINVLGTGQLIVNTPGSTAQPTDIPTIANASGSQTLSIDLPVTFQSGAKLNTQGTVQFTNQVTLNGTTASTINALNSLAFTNRIVGTGSTQFEEANNVTTTVSSTVASAVTLYQLGTGELDLGGVLQGTAGGTNQVFGKGGNVKLLAGLKGGGGIDMLDGTLLAASAGGYTGNITLEQTPSTAANGSVQMQVTPGTSDFGAGQIILATPSTSDGNAPKIVNTTGVQQDYSLGNQVSFQSASVAFGVLNASLNVSGSVSFGGGIGFQGANHYIFTSASSDVVTFPSLASIGATGSGRGLFLDGPGTFNLLGTLSGNVNLTAFDLTASGAGSLNLGGALLGGANQVTVDAGAVVMQGSSSVSGSGGITVMSGTLTSDPTPSKSGDLTYTGQITLNSGVVATDFDSIDRSPFGSGTLTLNAATLQSSAAATVNGSAFTPGIDNPIVSTGSTNISGKPGRFKLAALNISDGTLTFSGDVVLVGVVTGPGAMALVDSTTILEVPGSNPGYKGIVIGDGGRIFVSQQNGALGTAKLDTGQNAGTQFTVETATIADPILNNPVEVVAGTLILQGLLTFPAGITVDPGATLDIEGAGSQIVVSGALAGSGNIIVGAGTFTPSGATSGFTGGVTFTSGQITPTLAVSDAGGIYNGSPFPATVTLAAIGAPSGPTLDGIAPTLAYFVGNTATGTGSVTAPTNPGTYTVVANFAGDSKYAPVTSSPATFTITAPVAKLVFLHQPCRSRAGKLDRVVVGIENSDGQRMLTDDSTVTLSIASGPGTLGGTVSVKAFHGVAVFRHLLLTTAGKYTLEATDGSDVAVNSRSFQVTPAAPAKLVFASQPISTGAGDSIGPVVVDVEDQYGNLETDFNTFITLSLDPHAHCGTLRGSTKVRAVDGVAKFSNLSIDAAGTYQLEASVGPRISSLSSAFTISPGPATQNRFVNLPSNVRCGR